MNKEDTIAIIRSILSSTIQPYSISSLNKEFKNETGMDIPFFGYSSISNFLHSIPQDIKLTGIYPVQQVSLVINEKSGHIVSLVKNQKCGKKQKKIVISKNNWIKTRTNNRFTGAQEFQNIVELGNLHDFKEPNIEVQSLKSSRLLYLNNFLCSSESVLSIDLKLHAFIGEYVEICPCDIVNPHKFYFHFRKYKRQFGDFMNDLQVFYDSHEEIPKIDVSLVRPKQICAVFHKMYEEMQWCRAEIREVVSDGQVIVDLIDFGSSAGISKDKLKFLHKNFISFPRQACAGFLANIKPPKKKEKWSFGAIRRFCDLAFHKDLVAGVVSVDGCSLGLALSFTKGPEIHINDTLVKEGHAEFEMKTKKVIVPNEDSALSKTFSDRNKFLLSKTFYDKPSDETLTLSRSEKRSHSEIQAPIFYAPNVYSSNSRLKKMFSKI